jgi:hypothetical protein
MLEKQSKYFCRLFTGSAPIGGWTEIQESRCVLDLPLFVQEEDIDTFLYLLRNIHIHGHFPSSFLFPFDPNLDYEKNPTIEYNSMPKPGTPFGILYVAEFLECNCINPIMKKYLANHARQYPRDAMQWAILAHNWYWVSMRDRLFDSICAHAETYVAWDIFAEASEDFQQILCTRKDFLPMDTVPLGVCLRNRDPLSAAHVVLFTIEWPATVTHYFRTADRVLIESHKRSICWDGKRKVSIDMLAQTYNGIYFACHPIGNGCCSDTRIIFIPRCPTEPITMGKRHLLINSITADDTHVFMHGRVPKRYLWDPAYVTGIYTLSLDTGKSVLRLESDECVVFQMVCIENTILSIQTHGYPCYTFKVVWRVKETFQLIRILSRSDRSLVYVGRIGAKVYFRTDSSFLSRNVLGDGVWTVYPMDMSYIIETLCWEDKIFFATIRPKCKVSDVEIKRWDPEFDTFVSYPLISGMISGCSLFGFCKTIYVTCIHNRKPRETYFFNEQEHKWQCIPRYRNTYVYFFPTYTSTE